MESKMNQWMGYEAADKWRVLCMLYTPALPEVRVGRVGFGSLATLSHESGHLRHSKYIRNNPDPKRDFTRRIHHSWLFPSSI